MKNKLRTIRPLLFLILINIIGFMLIAINKKDTLGELSSLCLIMCVTNIVAYLFIYLFHLGDNYLFIIISMLSTIGIIIQSRINVQNGIRQMKLYLTGAVVFFVVMLLYMVLKKHLARLLPLYFGTSILLFILTMLFGTVKNGSKNWIIIGGMSIQPSEFVRILFVLSLACALTGEIKKNKKILDYRLISASVITYINVLFLIVQREWGIGLLFFSIYLLLIYIYSDNKLFLFGNIVLVMLGGIMGHTFMSHIQVRVEAWLDPFKNISGTGYQLAQSLFAIGAGGFSGTGIGNGSPYFIPVVSSDFIFSAICEETGILGGISVILLYFLLVYRAFKISLSSTNSFHKAVSAGLSIMLGVQTFIILGGVTKLIPLTGITLPFISLGGSSMLTTFASLGIIQAISAMKGEITDEIE